MVIDAAKGIEPQTRKLFEVCRLRSVPIITFVNKVDREGKSPFALLDEVAETLALDVSPQAGRSGWAGCSRACSTSPAARSAGRRGRARSSSARARPRPRCPAEVAEEIELARIGYPELDLEAYRHGDLTPVYFGSALKNFGVAELIEAIARFAPPPRPQPSDDGRCRRPATRSPGSCSRSRPTWTRSTATGSRSCGWSRAPSGGA
jgi:peptide chain release factor 3